jgi:two-component system phosphate regulon sensor histidine kinase PhoR
MIASVRLSLLLLAGSALVIAVAIGLAEIAPLAVAVAGAAAAALLLTLAAGYAVREQLRPLDSVARAIAGGDLRARVPARAAAELGALAGTFNTMAQTVEDLISAASRERGRLEAALNASADPILAVDADDRISYANEAAAALFERPREALVGEAFSWLLPHDAAIAAVRSSRLESERHGVLVERPNRQHLEIITAPIQDGGDWAALAVFHDVTDVRRLEQVRRDFIANVSHELRTPLASVKSVIETLQSGALDDPAAAREFLARANDEVDRLAQLVEELLELSRIESGELPLEMRPVALAELLRNAVERLRDQAEGHDITLELRVAPETPDVTGNAERLERAAVNLIHNALKFSPAGSCVRVSATPEDGAVVVRVSDQGTGIPPRDLPRVFERFYKGDRSRGGAGTGLGLAIVKHTIEAHGGTVAVESTEGRGSTFSFSIPIH